MNLYGAFHTCTYEHTVQALGNLAGLESMGWDLVAVEHVLINVLVSHLGVEIFRGGRAYLANRGKLLFELHTSWGLLQDPRHLICESISGALAVFVRVNNDVLEALADDSIKEFVKLLNPFHTVAEYNRILGPVQVWGESSVVATLSKPAIRIAGFSLTDCVCEGHHFVISITGGEQVKLSFTVLGVLHKRGIHSTELNPHSESNLDGGPNAHEHSFEPVTPMQAYQLGPMQAYQLGPAPVFLVCKHFTSALAVSLHILPGPAFQLAPVFVVIVVVPALDTVLGPTDSSVCHGSVY